MTQDYQKKARRPSGHGGAVNSGACEGRVASPSNPFNDNLKSKILRCRVTQSSFDKLNEVASYRRLSMADLMREALGMANTRKFRPIPKADPALLRQIAGIGNNLNQIAYRLNREARMGAVTPMDALALAAELVVIERQLGNLVISSQCRESLNVCS